MKRYFYLLAVAALAALAVAGTASADVPRYQTQTATLTADVMSGAYIHVYTVTINPCDGSFVGTGGIASLGLDESVSGTFDGTTLVFRSTYLTYNVGYEYSYSGPISTDNGSAGFPVTFTLGDNVVSSFKNHGAYVKSMGGGSAAGKSCIGRPLPLSFTQSGTVDSSSLTGTTITLPDEGIYRIDVSGTWDNGVWYDVDAEYVQQADLTWAQGWPGYPTVDFGDLQVNSQFVDWGAYSAAHTYSYTGHFGGSPLNLRVWDMWGDLVTDGHADNVGSLSYTITYVGP